MQVSRADWQPSTSHFSTGTSACEARVCQRDLSHLRACALCDMTVCGFVESCVTERVWCVSTARSSMLIVYACRPTGVPFSDLTFEPFASLPLQT